jgi:spoIIIJ-associated protein
MDWIEVTARTMDEAKELALDRLGVVEDELEYEVLDEARSGLFGIGRVDARIRARVKPLSREKPSDRRRRRKAPDRAPRGNRSVGGSDRSGSTRPSTAGTPAAAEGSPGGGNGESRSASGASRRRRGGRGRGRGGAGSGNNSGPNEERAGAVEAHSERPEVEVESVPVAAQAEHAAEFTNQLVRTMGFPATVRTEIDDDDVTINVEGEDLGPLVGPKGATLQALEEVVRAAVQHFAGGHSAWIHVDVGGYRERRREALATFARKVASEVAEAGAARVLEPMNAADRKVVHDALSDVPGVETGSEGEEPRRRVVIRPA